MKNLKIIFSSKLISRGRQNESKLLKTMHFLCFIACDIQKSKFLLMLWLKYQSTSFSLSKKVIVCKIWTISIDWWVFWKIFFSNFWWKNDIFEILSTKSHKSHIQIQCVVDIFIYEFLWGKNGIDYKKLTNNIDYRIIIKIFFFAFSELKTFYFFQNLLDLYFLAVILYN